MKLEKGGSKKNSVKEGKSIAKKPKSYHEEYFIYSKDRMKGKDDDNVLIVIIE